MFYDFGGEVESIYNAEVKENDYFSYVAHSSDNFGEITPNSSTNFGYTLVDAESNYFPNSVDMIQSRQEITEGLTIELANIYDAYDTFGGQLILTNTTDNQICMPEITINTNFSLLSNWGYDIIDLGENSYTITSKFDTGIFINIPPNSSYTLQISGSNVENPQIESFSATELVVKNEPLEQDTTNIPSDGEITDPNIDTITDTDGDDIPDYYEIEYFDSDPDIPDTDGDALPDGYEVMILETSPLLPDTDDNGISDANEDFDGDNLTNIQEYEFETDPFEPDTDDDGLTDAEEISIYGTNPLVPDSDDDDVSDGLEIELELNPNNSTTDGTADGERNFPLTKTAQSSRSLVSVTLDISLPAKCFESFTIDVVNDNEVFLNNKTPGYSDFVEFWTETLNLPELPNSIGDLSKNTGTTSTLPANKEDALSNAIMFNGHAYLFIYTSVNGKTWEQAKAYCESMGGHLATITSNAEKDFLEENRPLNHYWLGGIWNGTNWSWVTNEAAIETLNFQYYGGSPQLISDNFSLCAMGRNLYHINYNTNYLSTIGILCEWDNIDLKVDTDGDDLSDYYEQCINARTLTDGCGVSLTDYDGAVQLSWNDPNNKDSDGDGLEDGEEVRISYKQKSDGTYRLWSLVISNPCIKDTDGDKYNDYDESYVWNSNPRKNEVKLYNLTNKDYVRILNDSSQNWVNLDGTSYSFGGNQGWFLTDAEEENESSYFWPEYVIEEAGCGLIAVGDTILYLTQTGKIESTMFSDLIDLNADGSIDFYSYINYILALNATYFPLPRATGLNGVSMSDGLKSYDTAGKNELDIKWRTSKDILKNIKKQISGDIPVPISIGPSLDEGVVFYKSDETSNNPYDFIIADNSVKGHYITITGVIEDNVKKRTMLEISTWGEKNYIDYDEYIDFIKNGLNDYIFNNILSIKVK
ncbi:MAG: C-type lectin domain-containing protein [Oscillospiraceae bacterium]|nr:C-type lectin domain-containing protein [Oscillospiraceae bacterium]